MKLYKKNKFIENGFVSAAQKHINGDFSEHRHDFFEIEFIIDGTGTYIIDGIPYTIGKNMLFLMSPAEIHAIKSCDAEIINVMFSCQLCSATSLFSLFNPSSARVMQFSDCDASLILGLLYEIISSKTIDYSEAFLNCLLYKMVSENHIHESKNNTYIQTAIIHILENFHTNLTLSKTAEHLGLAPAYFSSLFQKELGIGFKEYLDNIRFEHALKLLIFTGMSVCEICGLAGFADYTNFARRFKKKYHCTPTGYRKINKSYI